MADRVMSESIKTLLEQFDVEAKTGGIENAKAMYQSALEELEDNDCLDAHFDAWIGTADDV